MNQAYSGERAGPSGRRKRLLFLVCIFAVASIGSLAAVDLFYSRPVGSGPAGPQVDRAAFEKIWTDRPVLVVGIGDSITAGLGADSPSHTFFNRVIVNPEDEFDDMQGICLSAVLSDLRYDNFAISGSESCWHRDMIRDRLESTEDAFGIVLMTSGGNDLIHNYGRSPPRECAMYGATVEQAEPWIDNYRERLREMLSLITERFPLGCEIYIGDIYDPTDGVGDAPSIFLPDWPDGLAIHARYNDVIREVADEFIHVHVVPLYKTFLGHGSHCRQFWRATYDKDDPHYWFYANIEDPNDRGYDAIRRVFLNTIVENSQLIQRDQAQ
jgi:lysophospholipase L1-like esterase